MTIHQAWQPASLDQLCDINPQALPAGTAPNFRFRYLDIASVDLGRVSWPNLPELTFADSPSRARRVVQPSDTMLCTVRPALQSHAAYSGELADPVIASTGFAVLRPKNGQSGRFVFHKLFSNEVCAQLRALETGSNYPAVNESDLRRVTVTAPDGFEQQRIARALDALDSAIKQTEALIVKLRQVRSGLLNDLLTRGIDENGDIRNSQRENVFVDTPIGCLPEAWKIERLVATADRTENSFIDGDWIEAPHIRSEGVRLVQTGNIGIGKYVDKSDDKKFISQASFSALRCKPILPGDVLICRLADPVGRACIVPDNLGSAITSVDVTIYRPDANRLVNSFIVRWLNTHGMLLRCSLLAAGTTRLRISRTNLGGMLVPEPSIDEQREIARILDSADADIEAAESTRAKLCQLKAGLTDDLLTGRVRIPAELEMA